MSKKNQLIILTVLISYSLFCAITLGESWDENANLIIGQKTLNYLFSLGRINNYSDFRELYSPLYWALQNIIIKIFPLEYKVQITHIINLLFSLGAIFGISRVSKELFNKNVGQIVFLLLFFYPIFFGHMAINSKDTILAFCHVWIFYYLILYLKNQDNKVKVNNYIIIIPLLAALGTGIQILFGGTLLAIIFFLAIEIFYFKKFINKNVCYFLHHFNDFLD